MMDSSECEKYGEEGLIDSVQCWVWALSAQNNGEIVKSNLAFDPINAPFLYVTTDNCTHNCQQFQIGFEEYLKHILTGPELVEKIIIELQKAEATAKGSSIINVRIRFHNRQRHQRIKTCNQNLVSNFSNLSKSSLINLQNNQNLISKYIAIMREYQIRVIAEAAIVKKFIPKFVVMIMTADEIGSKAKNESEKDIADLKKYLKPKKEE